MVQHERVSWRRGVLSSTEPYHHLHKQNLLQNIFGDLIINCILKIKDKWR